MPSLLEDLLLIFAYFRCLGGFPFRDESSSSSSDGGGGGQSRGMVWSLSKGDYIYSVALLLFQWLGNLGVQIYMAVSKEDTFIDRLTRAGLSVTDIATSYTVLYLNSFAQVYVLYKAANLHKTMNKVTAALTERSIELGLTRQDIQGVTRKVVRNFARIYLVHLLSCFCRVCQGHSLLKLYEVESSIQFVLSQVFFGFSYFYFAWQPLACTLHLLLGQSIGVHVLQLNTFRDQLRIRERDRHYDAPGSEIQLSEREVDSVPTHGMLRAPALAHSLHSISGLLSASCGEVLLLTLGTCLLFLINGMLGALQIYDVLSHAGQGSPPQPVVSGGLLSMGLQNLFLAITGFLRAMSIFSCGESVARAFSEVKYNLEEYFLCHQALMTRQERAELLVLVERFSDDAPSPIRPKNLMSLNSRAALSAIGLIVTYLIVLVQFKLSESGCYC